MQRKLKRRSHINKMEIEESLLLILGFIGFMIVGLIITKDITSSFLNGIIGFFIISLMLYLFSLDNKESSHK